MVIKTDKKIMPAELRPFYLKKAVAKLTKEEITAVFKSDNEEFLSSFIPFIQNVNNIFSFCSIKRNDNNVNHGYKMYNKGMRIFFWTNIYYNLT